MSFLSGFSPFLFEEAYHSSWKMGKSVQQYCM